MGRVTVQPRVRRISHREIVGMLDRWTRRAGLDLPTALLAHHLGWLGDPGLRDTLLIWGDEPSPGELLSRCTGRRRPPWVPPDLWDGFTMMLGILAAGDTVLIGVRDDRGRDHPGEGALGPFRDPWRATDALAGLWSAGRLGDVRAAGA